MTIPADEEAPIDPWRPIIDPHHHLWEIPASPGSMQTPQRYLLPETLATIAGSGHNITHTVFVECHAMHRSDGPLEMRPVGETEFANGIAAMSASGNYGPCRIAHRIVANADLRLGADVVTVLEAHRARAGERFVGIRFPTAFRQVGMFGASCDPSARSMMRAPKFQEGARTLAKMGLVLDVWCFQSQLDELIALAAAAPELTIVLDHLATPDEGVEHGAAADGDWTAKMRNLASHPNVLVKMGGLGMDLSKPIGTDSALASSEMLAAMWRGSIETCIDLFSPQRCMFESNFPPDRAAGSYGAVWNAFKSLVRAYTEDEKDQMFRRTAARVYNIALE